MRRAYGAAHAAAVRHGGPCSSTRCDGANSLATRPIIAAGYVGASPDLPCGRRRRGHRSGFGAARTQDLLEHHRSLQRGRCRGRRARVLRQTQSQGRKDQLRRGDGSIAGTARERQGRCRCRHGSRLDEAAGARLRCEADSSDPWRLPSPDRYARIGHHQRRGVEGQGCRGDQHGRSGQEFHFDPGVQTRHRSGQGHRVATLPGRPAWRGLQKGEIQAFRPRSIASILRDRTIWWK